MQFTMKLTLSSSASQTMTADRENKSQSCLFFVFVLMKYPSFIRIGKLFRMRGVKCKLRNPPVGPMRSINRYMKMHRKQVQNGKTIFAFFAWSSWSVYENRGRCHGKLNLIKKKWLNEWMMPPGAGIQIADHILYVVVVQFAQHSNWCTDFSYLTFISTDFFLVYCLARNRFIVGLHLTFAITVFIRLWYKMA